MSLLIVGSASRITQNIIHRLSQLSLYKHITLTDLLPQYKFHQRYYALRKALSKTGSSTEVSLTKLSRTEDLQSQINNHQDLLFVTHDYFESVTSKTKLMELTAHFSKNKPHALFATPVEYDHYSFQDPLQNYVSSQQKVLEANPNASFIRSDIQDNTEFFAYLHKSKGFFEERLIQVPEHFSCKVVSGNDYASRVADALKNKTKGNVEVVRGEHQLSYQEVTYNKEVELWQTDHQKQNIRQLLNKYKSIPKKSVERI